MLPLFSRCSTLSRAPVVNVSDGVKCQLACAKGAALVLRMCCVPVGEFHDMLSPASDCCSRKRPAESASRRVYRVGIAYHAPESAPQIFW